MLFRTIEYEELKIVPFFKSWCDGKVEDAEEDEISLSFNKTATNEALVMNFQTPASDDETEGKLLSLSLPDDIKSSLNNPALIHEVVLNSEADEKNLLNDLIFRIDKNATADSLTGIFFYSEDTECSAFKVNPGYDTIISRKNRFQLFGGVDNLTMHVRLQETGEGPPSSINAPTIKSQTVAGEKAALESRQLAILRLDDAENQTKQILKAQSGDSGKQSLQIMQRSARDIGKALRNLSERLLYTSFFAGCGGDCEGAFIAGAHLCVIGENSEDKLKQFRSRFPEDRLMPRFRNTYGMWNNETSKKTFEDYLSSKGFQKVGENNYHWKRNLEEITIKDSTGKNQTEEQYDQFWYGTFIMKRMLDIQEVTFQEQKDTVLSYIEALSGLLNKSHYPNAHFHGSPSCKGASPLTSTAGEKARVKLEDETNVTMEWYIKFLCHVYYGGNKGFTALKFNYPGNARVLTSKKVTWTLENVKDVMDLMTAWPDFLWKNYNFIDNTWFNLNCGGGKKPVTWVNDTIAIAGENRKLQNSGKSKAGGKPRKKKVANFEFDPEKLQQIVGAKFKDVSKENRYRKMYNKIAQTHENRNLTKEPPNISAAWKTIEAVLRRQGKREFIKQVLTDGSDTRNAMNLVFLYVYTMELETENAASVIGSLFAEERERGQYRPVGGLINPNDLQPMQKLMILKMNAVTALSIAKAKNNAKKLPTARAWEIFFEIMNSTQSAAIQKIQVDITRDYDVTLDDNTFTVFPYGFKFIFETLLPNCTYGIYNMSDYGVPSERVRLIAGSTSLLERLNIDDNYAKYYKELRDTVSDLAKDPGIWTQSGDDKTPAKQLVDIFQGRLDASYKAIAESPGALTVKEALALAGVSTPDGFAFVKADNRNTAATNLRNLTAAVRKTNNDSNITFKDGEMIEEDYFTNFSDTLKRAEQKYKENDEYYTKNKLGAGVPAASLFFPDEYRRFKRIDHPRPMTIVTAQSHTAIPAGILQITDDGKVKVLTEREAIKFCRDFEQSEEDSFYGKGVQFARLLAQNRYFFACTKEMKDPTFAHNLLNVMGGFPLGVSLPDSDEWEWSQLKDCIGDAIPPSFMVQLFLDKSKYGTGEEPGDARKVLWLACLRYNKAQEDLMSTVLDRYKAFTMLPILVNNMDKAMAKAKNAHYVKVDNKEQGYELGNGKFFRYTDSLGQETKFGYLSPNTITQYNARLGELMRNCYDSGNDFLMWDFQENNYGFGINDKNSTRSAYNKWRDYVINLWIDKSVLESEKIDLYSDLLWAGRRVENEKENEIILSILKKLNKKGLYGISKIQNHEYYMTVSLIMTRLKGHYKNKNASPSSAETSDDSSVAAAPKLALTLGPSSPQTSDDSLSLSPLVEVQDNENLVLLQPTDDSEAIMETDGDGGNDKGEGEGDGEGDGEATPEKDPEAIMDTDGDGDNDKGKGEGDGEGDGEATPEKDPEAITETDGDGDDGKGEGDGSISGDSSDSDSSSSDSDGDGDGDALNMFFVVQCARSVLKDAGDIEHYYQTSTFDVSVLQNQKIDDWEGLATDVQIEEQLDTMPSPPAPSGSMFIVVRREKGKWTINELKRKRSEYAAFQALWKGVSADPGPDPDRDTVAPKRIRVDFRNLNLKNAPKKDKGDCQKLRAKLNNPFFNDEDKIESLWKTFSKKSKFIADQNPFNK